MPEPLEPDPFRLDYVGGQPHIVIPPRLLDQFPPGSELGHMLRSSRVIVSEAVPPDEILVIGTPQEPTQTELMRRLVDRHTEQMINSFIPQPNPMGWSPISWEMRGRRPAPATPADRDALVAAREAIERATGPSISVDHNGVTFVRGATNSVTVRGAPVTHALYDEATGGCRTCGGPLGESVSDDFCDDACQRAWHATRSTELVSYQEPDLPGRWGGWGYMQDSHHHVPWSGLPRQTGDLDADRQALLQATRTAVTDEELSACRLRSEQIAERLQARAKAATAEQWTAFRDAIAALQPTFDQFAETIASVGAAFNQMIANVAAALDGATAGIPLRQGGQSHARGSYDLGGLLTPPDAVPCQVCGMPLVQGRHTCDTHTMARVPMPGRNRTHGPPQTSRPPRTIGSPHTSRR